MGCHCYAVTHPYLRSRKPFNRGNFMQTQVGDISYNKRLAKNCLDLIFNQHKPEEAVQKYVGANYRQHNPEAQDGPQGVIAYASTYLKANPDIRMDFKRIIAEGDLVAVHSHLKAKPSDRGEAIVDIFRVENGKLVEHWDVSEPLPVNSVNKNTMF